LYCCPFGPRRSHEGCQQLLLDQIGLGLWASCTACTAKPIAGCTALLLVMLLLQHLQQQHLLLPVECP
jgi:hypothetical protein